MRYTSLECLQRRGITHFACAMEGVVRWGGVHGYVWRPSRSAGRRAPATPRYAIVTVTPRLPLSQALVGHAITICLWVQGILSF